MYNTNMLLWFEPFITKTSVTNIFMNRVHGYFCIIAFYEGAVVL